MANTNTEMKLEFMVNTQEARILRAFEVRCKRKAKKTLLKHRTNYPVFDDERKLAYSTRMHLRKEQRYLHLARAFIKDMPYKRVEESTREGNEPSMNELMKTLNDWGYFPDKVWVELWIDPRF